MSEEVVIFAIVEPAPGKLERLKELLKGTAEWIKNNEPDTLEFSIFESGSDEGHKLSIFEKYANKAAMEKHESTQNYKTVMSIMMSEELIAGAPIISHGKGFAGFGR